MLDGLNFDKMLDGLNFDKRCLYDALFEFFSELEIFEIFLRKF
jgi:hypothetical protein